MFFLFLGLLSQDTEPRKLICLPYVANCLPGGEKNGSKYPDLLKNVTPLVIETGNMLYILNNQIPIVTLMLFGLV